MGSLLISPSFQVSPHARRLWHGNLFILRRKSILNTNTATNLNTLLFEGTITPHETSPLATAPMKPDFVPDARDRYPGGGKNTARLPRMRLRGEQGEVYGTYFPASGIRGGLRRCAVTALRNKLGHGWSLDTHRVLTLGGVKGKDAQGDDDLDRRASLRESHALLSLFGAAETFRSQRVSWIAGRLAVGNAIPESPLQPELMTGVRTDDVSRAPEEAAEFLDEETVAKLSEITRNERQASRLRATIKDLEQKADRAERNKEGEEEKKLRAEIKPLKEQLKELGGENVVSVQMPLDGYEVIPPETPLRHQMSVHRASDAEAGLLLAALQEFSLFPILGAHYAHGCGVVRAEWTVRRRVGDAYQQIGKLILSPFSGLEIEGDELIALAHSWAEAWNASAERLRGLVF